MTSDNKPTDNLLEQLYTARKQQHPAPSSIKKNVRLKQSADRDLKKSLQRLSYAAVSACTLVLIGLIFVHQTRFNSPAMQYQIVQLHSLNSESMTLSDDINQRYAKHYNDYLNSQKNYAQHHQKVATLKKVDSGWQLETCDQQIVSVSNELLLALSHINKLDTQLNTGDIVDIAFDQSGIILAIQHSGRVLQC